MRRSAFTLIELVIVMAIIAIMAALVIPALATSMTGRELREEATRFVAVTEYARSEAISQGVPIAVWVEIQNGRYGAEAKSGYDSAPGPMRAYTAAADVKVEVSGVKAAGGRVEVGTFGSDGTLMFGAADTVNFTDRRGNRASVVQSANNWGYEIARNSQSTRNSR